MDWFLRGLGATNKSLLSIASPAIVAAHINSFFLNSGLSCQIRCRKQKSNSIGDSGIDARRFFRKPKRLVACSAEHGNGVYIILVNTYKNSVPRTAKSLKSPLNIVVVEFRRRINIINPNPNPVADLFGHIAPNNAVI